MSSCEHSEPKLALGLCSACYKKQYRAKHREHILLQERAQYLARKPKANAASRAYKRTPRPRYGVLLRESKQRNLPVQITFHEFLELFVQPCDYCETMGKSNSGYGLDRIDNDLGYCLTNVVPCCGPCNQARGNRLSYLEMHALTKFRAEVTNA